MHIHILGICGTFMGGIAAIASSLGHRVSGCDQNVYPPMSTQLEDLNIKLHQGYDPKLLESLKPDLVLVGNAMSRGNPMIEGLLEARIPFLSAPDWLHQEVLGQKWVMAVAGTHGKTTTSSMLTWVLEKAGLNPSFLIGGKPAQFDFSARMTDSDFFVIEADEYDTAFFDKRSKFVHYWPKTCILNNLEFDHADIFDSLTDIKKQFHHLVRLVPLSGLVIHPQEDLNIQDVLKMGCWSLTECIGPKGVWGYKPQKEDGSVVDIYFRGQKRGTLDWSLYGLHQVHNALSTIAAARHAGVDITTAIDALNAFKLPKRRMETLGTFRDVTIYDDFAHHPTAIKTTLEGLRARVKEKPIGVILDLGSNTMKAGHHQDTLKKACEQADKLAVFQPKEVSWPVKEIMAHGDNAKVFDSIDDIIAWFQTKAVAGDHWVVMSNGGFGGIHDKLKQALLQNKRHAATS